MTLPSSHSRPSGGRYLFQTFDNNSPHFQRFFETITTLPLSSVQQLKILHIIRTISQSHFKNTFIEISNFINARRRWRRRGSYCGTCGCIQKKAWSRYWRAKETSKTWRLGLNWSSPIGSLSYNIPNLNVITTCGLVILTCYNHVLLLPYTMNSLDV